MNPATAMLYPIMLLLPAADMIGGGHSVEEYVDVPQADAGKTNAWPEQGARQFDTETQAGLPAGPFTVTAFRRIEPESAWQVRIEQRMTIRISPRASRPVTPDMFVALPDEDDWSNFTERKIGKCLPIGAIAGVQPSRDSRLLLFLRDRRIVAAELERACRARDFYSGFYLARTSDGQICVDRDTLLSRSGMNCKLTRIRQLVEDGR